MRFATIGSNFIVHRFLEAAREVEGLEYTAAYSRDENTAKTLASQYGAKKTYTDLEQMAQDDEIEMVYIASPNALHWAQAILMMGNGKHVLCEKPIASNSAELKKMQKIADENNVVLMEAMKSVHCTGYSAVSENLHKLGVIRNVTFNFLQYSSRYDNYKNGIIENAFKPELSNGALMDIGVYTIHMLLSLFGEPTHKKASAIKLSNGADAAGSIICEYDTFIATLIYSKIATFEGNQIQGELGTMLIDKISDIKNVEIIYRDGTKEVIPIDKKVTMVYEIEKFISFVQNKNANLSEILDVSNKQMKFLDEVRAELDIVFPADRV